ncbi:Uncharacterised protein [Kingella potus]|uniref:Uncharacterized protein n=1 Tax=Kingella potus TaxID=265175 RepID=A0A377QZK3_9NEIS|nr:hypothetical protein [Kingella potus]UOP00798.1 hypothetical protein LVJ84_13775 [Kingella potus]STR00437.1 Uncharacterised protein [Kingella potus]
MISVFSIVVGICFALFALWYGSKTAADKSPVLRIAVPDNAESSSEWQRWAQENGYKSQGGGLWKKGTGMLTSATEIRFEGKEMQVCECVNYLFGTNRFALNAPSWMGRPVRAAKLKALNGLLAQWQIEPVSFG